MMEGKKLNKNLWDTSKKLDGRQGLTFSFKDNNITFSDHTGGWSGWKWRSTAIFYITHSSGKWSMLQVKIYVKLVFGVIKGTWQTEVQK